MKNQNTKGKRLIAKDTKGHSRNRLCPCGSGKKYKKCCWHAHHSPRQRVENALQ